MRVRRYAHRLVFCFASITLLTGCVSGPRFADSVLHPNVVVASGQKHLVLSPSAAETPLEAAVGLVFYPGGLVEAEAYLPLLDDIAAAGYPVLLVEMPFALAVFSPMRGVDLGKQYPDVDGWVVAGHSLGGAMAARAVYEAPEAFGGLILLASYPPNNNDLSDFDIPVMSIYAELDGLAPPEEIIGSAPLLPENATFVEIAGGNHAQFGSYGRQDGDNEATIGREMQQRLAVRSMLLLLQEVSGAR